MTKKKLNIDTITNELEGASLFFAKPASPPLAEPSSTENSQVQTSSSRTSGEPQDPKRPVASKEDINVREATVKPRSEKKDVVDTSMHASNNANMQAYNQPLINEAIIETIRRAVKDVGKDSATYRFTPEEKKALLELSFSYKMQGYKTSENELSRIAINFLLEDHRQNGRNSVLQRVLDALSK